ncbi:TetR/AcrR family transcriptional regulator [Arthrobacter crystallopoietes]|jgi:AcrR family transcriptional regulator
MTEIIRIAREHLATEGAAALSLRAVARDLGVVSSAVYRYVKNRDELLTLLVVDAYNELGDEVDKAVVSAGADYLAQYKALARAVRGWGIGEPSRYALLFGSPVPGYRAPAERTTGPGTRVVRALVDIIESAHRSGKIAPVERGELGESREQSALQPVLADDLARIRSELDLSAPEPVVIRGVMVWSALFGAVSFEVFGQYGENTFTDPAGLFEQHLDAHVRLLGLE